MRVLPFKPVIRRSNLMAVSWLFMLEFHFTAGVGISSNSYMARLRHFQLVCSGNAVPHPQRFTDTLMNVAGIVVPPFALVFFASASSTSCRFSSSTRPLFSAASKAFMVGP